MTQVFVSYSRQDARRVRPVVRALERAGLEVWWDSRLVGGSPFSSEIEQAIERAQAVVVLWSTRSVQSPWVLDEAARGRDRGKLVPASLDGIEPPIGFGQFHTIDLHGGTGGGERPIDALVSAVSAMVEAGGGSIGVEARSRWWRIEPRKLAMVAALLLVVAAAAYWLTGKSGQPDLADRGKVSVAALVPINNNPDERAAAQATTQAVERTFANNRLVTVAGPSAETDFGMRGTVAKRGEEIFVDADIVDPQTSRILWSAQFKRSAGENALLADQVAIRLADVLRCAVYTLRRMPQYDGPELHSRVLRYCEAERSAGQQYGELVNLAKALIEVAPRSAQAHAYLASALSFTSPDIAATRKAIADTLALDPDNGAVRWAMATLEDRTITLAERERLIREGMELDPENIWFKNYLANLMRVSGRYDEAFRYFQEFVSDYPLDHHQRSVLAYLAAERGDITFARRSFKEIQEVRPEDRNHKLYAIRAEVLFGDPASAREWAARLTLEPHERRCLELVAAAVRREKPGAALIKESCGGGRVFPIEHALIVAGHVDEAVALLDKNMPQYNDQARFGPVFVYERGSEVIQRDPRLIALLDRIDVADYWLETGKFADFCSRAMIPYDCSIEAKRVIAQEKS